MFVDRSLCRGFVCRDGRTDSSIDNCPMHGPLRSVKSR